jgi:hypothetical protein
MRGTSLEVGLIFSGMVFRFLVDGHYRLTAAVRQRQGELLSFWRAMDHHMVLVAASMKPRGPAFGSQLLRLKDTLAAGVRTARRHPAGDVVVPLIAPPSG